MTNQRNYKVGRGRAAKESAPRARKAAALERVEVVCACGRVHILTVTFNTSLVIVPCGCGALVRWTPAGATAEGVE